MTARGDSDGGNRLHQFFGLEKLRTPFKGLESVKCARSSEELSEIYRLRYQVYVERQKKPYPADHLNRLLSDELDGRSAIFYTRDAVQNKIINSLRISSGSDPFSLSSFAQEFNLAPFLGRASPSEMHFYSRLVSQGTSGVNFQLTRILQRAYILQRQCEVRFIFCRTSAHLVPFFERLGFVCYGTIWEDPIAGVQQCMVALPPDRTHLEMVGSPIRQIASLFPEDRADRMWLEATFPQTTRLAEVGSAETRALVEVGAQ